MSLRALLACGFVAWSGPAFAQTDERIAVLDAVCLTPSTYEAFAAAAEQNGFIRQDASEGRLSTLLAFATRAYPGGTFAAYSRDNAAGQLDVMISRIPSENGMVHGCGLYDFVADAPLEPEAFSDFLPDTPVSSFEHGATVHRWREPRLLPGVFSVKETFVPSDSDVGRLGPFHGLALTVDRIGS